jgi:hypothetical protein
MGKALGPNRRGAESAAQSQCHETGMDENRSI